MSAQRKPEMTPDEAFLQQAFKDGRATKHDVSMKAIGTPDVGLQARVPHLDMDHCRRLERAKEATGSLSPIVLFRETQKRSKLYLADGHHRHYVYQNLKCASIPAYVIDSDAAELEAVEFATMCNREMCLGRKPEDIDRAIEMLLLRELWWKRADAWIADHVGCSCPKISRIRAKVVSETGIKEPQFVERRAGDVFPYRKSARDTERRITKHVKTANGHSFNSFSTRIGRTRLRAPTLEELNNKVEAAKKERAKQDYRISEIGMVSQLRRYGFAAAFPNNMQTKLPGIKAYWRAGIVAVSCSMDLRGIDDKALPLSVGRLIAARAFAEPSAKMVIVCYKADGPAELIDIYEEAGVEFMTPDELIASLGPVIPEELKSDGQ